jgi:cell division protein ZapA (FtsZ GTPase activity inhibitor)
VDKFKEVIPAMQEMIPINIVIGDRTYRIKANPSDEEVVRKTVKTINEKVIEFKTQFAGKDMQDYIAMVLVWFATQISAVQASDTVSPEITQRLESMEKQLDEALNHVR